MNSARLLIATFLVSLCISAYSAPYENEVLSLDVPAGFQGPVTQSLGAEAVVVAYTKPHSSNRGTLLQITTYDFGSKLPKPTKQELGAAAEKYLLQFLAGIERRRSSFQTSKPMRLTLGGIPAARVAWKGVAEGQQMSGTMYCVVVGSRVISFHTQDFEGAPSENTAEAMRAFESVRFKHAG
jgi:hypothetical protein